MTIILTAQINTNIEDLGIILTIGDTINLLDSFTPKELIESEDLETAINNNVITVDSEIVDYDEFIYRIKQITEHEHHNFKILQHNIYETNYFEVTKINDRAKYITYYTDGTKTQKIQEDEIIRGGDRVSQIITRKYDVGGTLIQEITQTLNRDVDERVESIDSDII